MIEDFFLVFTDKRVNKVVNRDYITLLYPINGAEINSKINPFSITSLHIASSEGQLDVVKYLLENGADIHTIDINNMTPLHFAIQNGHLEAVKYLTR